MNEAVIKTPAYIKIGINRLIQVDLFDEIYLKKINERKIHIIKTEGYKIPTNNLNPVYRVAAELQKIRPNKFGVEIKIKKNIPAFSGLNSQLSNAAEVLKKLNKIWDFNLGTSHLYEIAGKTDPEITRILKNKAKKPKNVILIRPKYIKNHEKQSKSALLKHFPDLKEMIKALNEIGCYESGLTGNGPMIYGFFKGKIDESDLKKNILKKLDFIWIGKTS